MATNNRFDNATNRSIDHFVADQHAPAHAARAARVQSRQYELAAALTRDTKAAIDEAVAKAAEAEAILKAAGFENPELTRIILAGIPRQIEARAADMADEEVRLEDMGAAA